VARHGFVLSVEGKRVRVPCSADRSCPLQAALSAEELSAKLLLLSSGQSQPIAGVIDVKQGECISILEADDEDWSMLPLPNVSLKLRYKSPLR